MILTHDVILAEIRAGRIAIDPFDESMVGPASIDLHLGDEIRVLSTRDTVVEVHDDTDYEDLSTVEPHTEPFALLPGETVLGITRERIRLPGDVCGWLEGRSRFARLGLMIHVTAGFVSPGIDNRQVLEISNVSAGTLAIHPRTRICQIILQRAEGSAIYAGRFAKQMKL
jgi:dCTP deaminase